MTGAELEAFAKAISRVLGWAYFLSWYIVYSVLAAACTNIISV